jgi:chemotaxis signal transduction protein
MRSDTEPARIAPRLGLGAGRSVVLFRLGEGRYAVESRAVRHVRPAAGESDRSLAFDGRPWPLLPLRGIFGLPPAPGGHLVLVEDADGRRAALVTDGVLALARLDETEIVPLPPVYAGPERQWFAAVGRLEDQVVIILDVAGVLAAAGTPVGAGA